MNTCRLPVITLAVGLTVLSHSCLFAGSLDTADTATESRKVIDVPDRDVTYVAGRELPDWKIYWDQARALCREGKSGQALVQYELVLQKKKSLDEARWEYAQLLMREKLWSQAGHELGLLHDHQPENSNIQFARARVFLETGHPRAAADLYRRVLNRGRENGDVHAASLRGLIRCLEALGETEDLSPLLEKIVRRDPEDLDSLKKLCRLKLASGHAGEVRSLLAAPLQSHPDDPGLLQISARAADLLDEGETAASLRERIVKLDPDNLDARRRLLEYCEKQEMYKQAIVHLEYLLRADPGSSELILKLSQLYRHAGKPGKSLEYLNMYLDIRPDDPKILRERNEIRKLLAVELVPLVEQTKAERLWQDLAAITSDRAGVYEQMASFLRDQGKNEVLLEVLQVLYEHNPGDEQVYRELAALLHSRRRSGEAKRLKVAGSQGG